jgi:hypothetical protein
MPASRARGAECSVVNGHAEDVFSFTVTMPERWPERSKPAPSMLWTYLERGFELGTLARKRHSRRRFSIYAAGSDSDSDVDAYELLDL